MSNAYQVVQWNRHKRVYDTVILAGVLLYMAGFVLLTQLTHPAPNDLWPVPVILLRATATCAFILLHVILLIGPMARLNSNFAPLLYNRRHLGVTMFSIALVHGVIATFLYHGMGNANPILGIFKDNTRYESFEQFPFQTLGFGALLIFSLMASTSHDYWLKNLGASFWKAMHMFVYLAYALVVMHVVLGVLQSEMHPAFVILTAAGTVAVVGSHLWAGFKENRSDLRGVPMGHWVRVGLVDEIPANRALIATAAHGERVAVFKHGNKISAISNVCAHQGGPLGEGTIIDGCLTCPWHGYQYLVENGQSPPPFTEKVPTYRVRLQGREVLVDPLPLEPGTPVEPATIDPMEERRDGQTN